MREVKDEVMKTIATLVTTAFGLIAALAWNEAIKAIIGMFFKAGTGVIGLLIYAVLITIIAVIATILIARAIPTEPPVQDVRIVEDTTRKFYLVYLLQTALFTLKKTHNPRILLFLLRTNKKYFVSLCPFSMCC